MYYGFSESLPTALLEG